MKSYLRIIVVIAIVIGGIFMVSRYSSLLSLRAVEDNFLEKTIHNILLTNSEYESYLKCSK